MDDPLARPCRYCGSPYPCDVHAVDCPSSTNLWPVQERDIGVHGVCCFDCGTPFAVGEFYVHRPYAESAVIVACLSCAAAAMVGGVER